MTHRILRALPESGLSTGDPRPEGRAAQDDALQADAAEKATAIIRALRFAENAHQAAALTAALHAVRGLGSGRDSAPGTGTRRALSGPSEIAGGLEPCDRPEPRDRPERGDAAEPAEQRRRAAGRSAAVKAA